MSGGLDQNMRRALDWADAAGIPIGNAGTGAGAIREVERAATRRLGAAGVVCVASGTTALRVALTAADVGPDDEVICPAYDWVSASAATRALGATPVLADCASRSALIDNDAARDLVTDSTKAIVVTHVFGAPAPVDAIACWARPLGIAVIEDCAHALGTTVGHRAAGSIGDYGVFSFTTGKLIDAGTGGMVAARERAGHERVVQVSQHPLRQRLLGIETDGITDYQPMNPLAALIVAHQLASLDDRLARHRERLVRTLEGRPNVETAIVDRGGDTWPDPSWTTDRIVIDLARLDNEQGSSLLTRPLCTPLPAALGTEMTNAEHARRWFRQVPLAEVSK